MDPRDMITKNVTKSELIGNGKIISDINKAIEEFQLDGMRKQQMGPGKVGHKVGSEGRKALAARFRGQGGDKFDNSACLGAMKGKVGDPGAFCRALEGYSTGGYEATTKPEGEKMGKVNIRGIGARGKKARRAIAYAADEQRQGYAPDPAGEYAGSKSEWFDYMRFLKSPRGLTDKNYGMPSVRKYGLKETFEDWTTHSIPRRGKKTGDIGKMGPIQSGVMLEMARRGGRRAAKIAGAVGTVAGGAAGYLLGRRKKKKKEAMVTEGKESKISRAIQFLRRKATLSKPKLKDLVMSGPRDPMRD